MQHDQDPENKINLNTASREELMLVKGVGPQDADRILAYGDQNGRFRSVEDLANVRDLSSAARERLRARAFV